MKFINVTERTPTIGDYYYCMVDTKQDHIQKTIVEWYKYPNGNYDWALEDVQHYGGFKEEAEVIAWLDENVEVQECTIIPTDDEISEMAKIHATKVHITFREHTQENFEKGAKTIRDSFQQSIADMWLLISDIGDFYDTYKEMYPLNMLYKNEPVIKEQNLLLGRMMFFLKKYENGFPPIYDHEMPPMIKYYIQMSKTIKSLPYNGYLPTDEDIDKEAERLFNDSKIGDSKKIGFSIGMKQLRDTIKEAFPKDNQCDGCQAGFPVDKHGIHQVPYPSGSMVCEKEKYNPSMKGLQKECMGILNQLFDLAKVDAAKRQEINDRADQYLRTQILRLFSIYHTLAKANDMDSDYAILLSKIIAALEKAEFHRSQVEILEMIVTELKIIKSKINKTT